MALISIVVPCYNECAVIQLFYDEIKEACRAISEDLEILFIDDGSRDSTLAILKCLSKNDKRVRFLSFSRNFGKEAAIYAGLENAKGDYVVTMDADLQHPPEFIPKMYALVKSGEYDSVTTCRENRDGEPKIRAFFSSLFYKAMRKISRLDMVDGAQDFRFMKRTVVEAVLQLKETNRFLKGIYCWVGFKTAYLPYSNVKRAAGETKWSFWKLFLYSIEGLVSFSTVPLALASVFGLLFCLLSFLMIIFIIVRTAIWGDPVGGWPTMMCTILLIGGIQLFTIGILGQYMAKTYLEVKKRPVYIVRETEETINNK